MWHCHDRQITTQQLYNIMGNEKATRIQTSLLNGAEKKALVWLAKRQPNWATSNMLTFIGTMGAILCAVGFGLANYNLQWMWLSVAGLAINWYGDSLDGSMARVRHTQRPVYGFFIDHNVDIFTIIVMCIGAGLSPIVRMDVALLVLVAYLAISAHTYIGTILKNEFKLTYGKLGPTEFRVIAAICIIFLIYFPWAGYNVTVSCFSNGLESLNGVYTIFDWCALGLGAIIFILLISSQIRDEKALSKIDPPKKFDGTFTE